jgi:hypothetical protein
MKGAKKIGYQFSFNEEREAPIMKTYKDYQALGIKASKMNEDAIKKKKNNNVDRLQVEGVYGIWCLDILPYADNIHWTVDFMHTASNICNDMLNSIRPTHSAISGLYYEHKNRTYDDKVVSACNDEKIFSCLNDINKPDWVLEIKECLDIDASMNNIIGQMSNEELVKNTMRQGRAEKSHDTIYWCIVYARLAYLACLY